MFSCTRCLSLGLLLMVSLWQNRFAGAAEPQRPNIIIIYADDIGYGDLGCYGAKAVKTPHCDRLAKNGLQLMNGYCSSGTCTPSRYSMLTGEYAFRKKGTGVLPGDAAMIIEPDRVTLPKILQQAGYQTGVVGKWHLGLGDGKQTLDWNTEINRGPREVGFHYSYIMAATGDRVPCVYLENQKVVGLDLNDPITVNYQQPIPGEPTGISERDTLKMDWSHGHNNAVVNGIGRIGHMRGGKAALWKDEDMADVFTRQGVEFITKNQHQPFCLYFATHDIHVPRVPHPRYKGQTTMGPRGDAIVEFDDNVGTLLATLDRLKLTEKTLIILSSDNGPVLDDGYKDDAVEKLGDHKPAGPLSGGKYSNYEGGTRVPFIVHWPAVIKPGVSQALVSQVDLCASFAALTGQKLAAGVAPDSLNMLPALTNQSATGRDYIIQHAGQLSIRRGNWKYVPTSKGKMPGGERLFDLQTDPGEKNNLASKHPDKLKELVTLLEKVRDSGTNASGASAGGTTEK